MTLEEAFIKGASDRFEEVKMASWVKLLKQFGAGGLDGAKNYWASLATKPGLQRQMIGNAVGAGLGVGGALLSRDQDEGLMTTMGRGLMYGAGGSMLGGLAGRHAFNPKWFRPAAA